MKTVYIRQNSVVFIDSSKDPKELFDKKYFELAARLLLNTSEKDRYKNRTLALKSIEGEPLRIIYQVHSKKRPEKLEKLYLRSQDIEKIFYTSVYGKLVSVDNPDYIPTE